MHEARDGQADAGQQQPGRHQPGHRVAVGGQAEERLHDGRGDGRGEHERRGGAVGVAALGDQEGQEGGHGALAHVDAGVAGGENADAAPIDARGNHADSVWAVRCDASKT